ncbi:MAG: PilZ domain-containing protein [Elusimicrobia bacterium]|nr:PilZ domain-containing protein [Candidatus Obscuribacterium magneticum]
MRAERRHTPRFSTSIPVGLRFSKGPFKEGWGRIMNLSPEGLLLETRFPLKVAGVIYASFSLQDGAQFNNLRTRIIRVSYEDGYFTAGIAFDDVVDQETLRDVIAALAYEGGLTLS